ncbi:MAG: hypothetical protein IPG79_08340 [Saprospiraceae bacterium]|nr:hypothetical protein [Saprospiraceae bacterium]
MLFINEFIPFEFPTQYLKANIIANPIIYSITRIAAINKLPIINTKLNSADSPASLTTPAQNAPAANKSESPGKMALLPTRFQQR